MGLTNYQLANDITSRNYPFRAVIMAAMIKAAPHDLIRLKSVFPAIWKQWYRSYHRAHGGLDLESEGGQ